MTEDMKTVRLSDLLQVWESYTGWYWFVTELHGDDSAFGLVRGFEIEWGYFSLKELRALARKAKVWQVPKRNWPFCPCVRNEADDARTMKGGAR